MFLFKKAKLFISLLALGLVIRLYLIPLGITGDINTYQTWGKATYENGLWESYIGGYFPIQYQIFALDFWISQKANIAFSIVIKLTNLLFDFAIFIILYKILIRYSINSYYVFLYWLHPFFLNIFALGYIDFQFSFFILLGVYLMSNDKTLKSNIIAGIPIAIAFLMKPQAQIIIVSIIIYALIKAAKEKTVYTFGLLIAPALLFFIYSISLSFYYNSNELYPYYSVLFNRELPSYLLLTESYLSISNAMPCLTAHQLNLWYPVAFLLKQPETAIYSVSDQILLFNSISIKTIAIFSCLTIISLYIYLVVKNTILNSIAFILIFGFSNIITTFIMTSSHENHLFLGGILLIFASSFNRNFFLLFIFLLTVQFININGLYGSNYLRQYYQYPFRYYFSFVSIALFFIIIFIEFKVLNFYRSIKDKFNVYENLKTIKKESTALWIIKTISLVFFLGLLIFITKLEPEKSGKKILYEVGMGNTDPRKVKLELTTNQFQEIQYLIKKNPTNYNEGQKSLISERTAEEILIEVGMGYIDPIKLKLTPNQLKEIKDLINKNPSHYNEGQKSLISEKTGKEILFEVGMGKTNPKDLKLTTSQINEINNLIKSHPNEFNNVQKSLIKK